jgi:spermidine/putrescine transport system substrate-binding protein
MTDSSQPMRTGAGLSRRTVLKTGAAVAGAVAAPAIVSPRVLASSGEVNVLMWSDYLPASFTDSFTQKTGIKINFTGIGSNEEILNKLKATKGRGFDIATPTMDRAPQWADQELLQPLDMTKIPIDKVNAGMAEKGGAIWDFGGKGTTWIPHIWGTESIAWRTDKWQPEGEFPSYGAIWDDANAGKTMGRAHSMMFCAGLYLERIGQLEPGSMWSAYESEEKMRPVWEKVTDWCIAKKKNIKIIWNDADTQKNGLMVEGVIVGQTWDGPALALKSAGEPVMYRAALEGAMAWIDGMAIPVGAENLDQAYAFIQHCYDAEAAGKAIDTHGYNSPVIGAEKHANTQYAKNFADAYPGDALQKLNPWPPTQAWYADVRAQYVNKFLSAS